MNWNKLLQYGELLLSLLVVFLMLVASVVYGGYLFGKKIGEMQETDSVAQALPAGNAESPAKPFHGDMTLEKLRAEDSLAASQKDSSAINSSADVVNKEARSEKASAEEKKVQDVQPQVNKAEENTKSVQQKTSAKSEPSISAGASSPSAAQLSEMGLADVVLTAYGKGLWQVTNAAGKDNGTIVASEPFASGVKGYAGPTPVFIYVKPNGTVSAVVAASNAETPDFFAALADEGLFKAWNGKTTSAAASMQVDGITGATFSSHAVIQNVQAALKHYHANTSAKKTGTEEKAVLTKPTKSAEVVQSKSTLSQPETEQDHTKQVPMEKKPSPQEDPSVAAKETDTDSQSVADKPNAVPSAKSASHAAYGAEAPDAEQMVRLGLQDVLLEVADTGVWNVKARDGRSVGTLLSSAPFSKNIKGYHGPTPLYLLISADGKIKSVLPMSNEETPDFFRQLEEKGLFAAWNGMTISEATAAEVDAVTGATFSSRAVIQNVRTTLARYQHETADNDISPVIGWLKTILVLVILAAGVLARYRFKKNKKVRVAVLALNVVVTGFFCGQFLSLGMIRDWVADGVDFIAVLPAFAMLVLTLILGFLGKPNHHCTWVCPLGSLQELAYRLPLPKVKLKPKAYKVMRYVRLSVFLLLMLLAWTGIAIDGILDYEPFSAFLITTAAPAVIILAVVFIVASVFVPNVWCKCFCVMGEALNLSQRKD
ncbi:FMN-binding protein [Pseudoprevotella muciniphila]|uniref:FMN-binding protein n=1 Tax=Pseudoprevotella muciniphila TaxID=2133944 RepID=A0A5P8E5N9_9BACT|nr:FMN-binding protein [Pseudoprevotella muciniphila]QFQ12325.1 FMN-binding protein [Pseudoprevotella muciniphila]